MLIKILIDFLLLITLWLFFYSNYALINFSIYFLLMIFLIAMGYILGKYHKYQLKNRFNIVYYLKSSFIEYIISSSIIYIGMLIIRENISYQSVQFLLLFITTSNFLSYLFDFIQKKYSRKKEQSWLYVGNKNHLKEFINIESFSKAKSTLILADKNYFNYKNNNPPFKGIVFSKKDEVKSFLRENPNFNNIETLSLLNWSERYLQILPSSYIEENHIKDILKYDISNSIEMRIKRVSDIFFSISLLIITSPIVIFLALLIKLEDSGEIFYSQVRTGLNGKSFKIYKLRSMKSESEKKGAQWARKNDSRVTKIGVILRKSRIDELPQLFSVIRGEMSLIGPRPERPEIEEELIDKIPYYELRNKFKPGISGWAQVNFPYGASIDDSRIKLSHDLYYIKNFSILLDIFIFIKTIKVVSLLSNSNPKN